MTEFQWAIDLAKELIDKNGEEVTVKVFTVNIPDPAFPNEQGPSTETILTGRAVFLNYNIKEAGTTYKDGTEIHRTDKKVLMAAKGMPVAPNLKGTIRRASGEIFRVQQVKTLDPDGPAIYHELQARK